MNEKYDKMYEAAIKGFNNAYVPYSKFKVGASLLLKNGEIISGCNIENSSYGLTICAERVTIFKAYSIGIRKNDIISLLVVGNTDKPISPCGACRQVMSDLLNQDCEVILTNLNKNNKITSVKELLPYSFSGEDLDE